MNDDLPNVSPEVLYKQVTEFVDEKTNLRELVERAYPNDNFFGICMTGLHTCGNLASASLRIFNNNNDIKSILNIGCCYHHLSEEFLDPYTTNSNYGFPMSNFLCADKFSLGRNARMLSSQSIDRKIILKESLSKSLLYRAVLQEMLQEHNYGYLDIQVGRIGAKCKTFSDYVMKVSKKLNLDFKLTNERLEEKIINYEEHWEKLQCYHALKMCFAPILELIIVLDRYLYLLENGHDKTYLIKLFDPVISPRCYALISIK